MRTEFFPRNIYIFPTILIIALRAPKIPAGIFIATPKRPRVTPGPSFWFSNGTANVFRLGARFFSAAEINFSGPAGIDVPLCIGHVTVFLTGQLVVVLVAYFS